MQIYYKFFISATTSSPNMTRDSNELNPGGFVAPHWFGGYVSIFSPQGVFGFSYPAVLHLYPVDYCRCCNLERKLFMPATGARPKKTKINLMDCICLMCSGVEI